MINHWLSIIWEELISTKIVLNHAYSWYFSKFLPEVLYGLSIFNWIEFIIWYLYHYSMVVSVLGFKTIAWYTMSDIDPTLNEIIILSFVKLCVNEFLGNDVLSHLNLTSNYIRHRFQHNLISWLAAHGNFMLIFHKNVAIEIPALVYDRH